MDRPMHRPERGLPRDPAMKEFVGARRGQGGRAANGCAASIDPCSRQRRPSGPNPLVQPLRKREGPPSKISRCWPARRWSAYGASLSFERFPAKDGHPPSRAIRRSCREGRFGSRRAERFPPTLPANFYMQKSHVRSVAMCAVSESRCRGINSTGIAIGFLELAV